MLGLNPTPSVASDAFQADIRYLHVQKGQTLHNIVRRLYPERRKEWPTITRDIVRLNPHAFIKNNPTRMKAGVRIELPKKSIPKNARHSSRHKPASLKPVGVVAESQGRVVAVNQSQITRILRKDQYVYLGDKVITGEQGSVRLRMIDNAILELRCFSIMVIEEYALNSTSRRSILNLLQGSLKKVTGTIGELTEDVYLLKTPVASIGVRGTEYALRVFQSKGCGGTIDADDGLYLEVIKGLVDVHNEAGRELIAKNEAVYVPLPQTAPKKIAIEPGMLKSGMLKPVIKGQKQENEDSSDFWWWLLGVIGLVLLI